MASKKAYQCADSSNTGPNIVYTGSSSKQRLHKNGTAMSNSPSTPKSTGAHAHGHKRNA